MGFHKKIKVSCVWSHLKQKTRHFMLRKNQDFKMKIKIL